jgi:hypothetical protein
LRLRNYTEGVREFQPRVSTLGTSSDAHLVTPKALANTFGVSKLTRIIPSVVASLQRWAEISERLRRKDFAGKTKN